MPQPTDYRLELAEQLGALRSLACRLAGSDDADDLAQQALVRALSHSKRPRRVRPWLRQVLRNEHRAQLRASTRRRSRESASASVAVALGLDETAEQARLVEALHAALRDLDPPYRRVLQARFFEERTAADIARTEGCPAGTIRWRLQEGLRRVRSKLDDRFGGDDWRAGMAAFAGLRLAPKEAGVVPMMKTTMFKWLAAGVLLAGTGTAAVALGKVREAERPSAERDAVETSPTLEISRLGGPDAPRRHSPAAMFEGGVQPRLTSPDSPDGDAQACDGACDGRQAFTDVILACEQANPLNHDERLDVVVSVGVNADDNTRVAESVRIEGEGQPVLRACLEQGLVGSELPGVEEAAEVYELKISLMGSKPVTREVEQDSPVVAPAEYAELHGLPMRSEGARSTQTIVECGEFDCPFCERVRPTLEQVLDEHPEAGIVWMHNPLPFHPGAMVAARASLAAHHQGKFWDMHELLFDEPSKRSEADMVAFASALKLDLKRFSSDMASEATQNEIDTQAETCRRAGGRGTPTFFIEDERLAGAQPYSEFDALLQ